MSNRARRAPQIRAERRHVHEVEVAATRRRYGIIGLVVGLIVAAAVIALVATGGGDSDNTNEPEIAFNGTDLPPLAAGAADPAIGLKAPLFVTDDLVGNRVVTGGGGGPNDTAKVVIFVAHWCPTCQREVPRLAQWLGANDIPEGVEIVTVSTFADPARDNHPPEAWFASVEWPLPVLVDSGSGDIANSFGMGSVPAWVVLDNQNFVLARTVGALTDADFDGLVRLAATGV